MKAALLPILLLGASGCASEEAPEAPAAVCHPLSFRACDTDACRGVQQCAGNGSRWSRCACTVWDASFEAAADAPSDVSTDSPDASADAEGGMEAAADAAPGDGGDASDSSAADGT